ncbi:cytochrome P450 [Streptomyces sp. NPDC056132]|uniref:cytochrome P450 n=1 Tax=Streptomyces sp. NPDC056132 TaxID=3345722 RepID=UPI0035DA1413
MSTSNSRPAGGTLPDPLALPLPDGEHGMAPAVFDQLRRQRPVAKVVLPSGEEAWLLTRHADIIAVGSDRRFSRDLTAGGTIQLPREDFNSVKGGIFNLDPPRHGLVRRILQPYFSPASAHELRGTITGYAHQLIDSLEAGPNPADLMSAYAVPLALMMACEVMAVPVEQRRAIMPETRAQMDWRQSSALIGASTQRLMGFADDVIAAKRAQGQSGQDPISALIRAQNAGDIDTDELRGTVMYLFLTSAEPVTGPTAVGVYSLLRHPEILTRLRTTASDDLWEQAVRELLRFHHNSATSLPRRALTDLDISGVTIRRGDLVITPWIAATWDPKHYKNPEKLRLGRAARERPDITFGNGPHFCLGANIAVTHLHCALRTLWDRLPQLTLAVRHIDIAWEPPEFLFTRPVELPITW